MSYPTIFTLSLPPAHSPPNSTRTKKQTQVRKLIDTAFKMKSYIHYFQAFNSNNLVLIYLIIDLS